MPMAPQPPSLISHSIDTTQQVDIELDLHKLIASPMLPALTYEFESDHIQYLNQN